MSNLSTDDIDAGITQIVLNGPHGPEAGVTLARIAGRAIKMLQEVVGQKAAVVTAATLLQQLKEGGLH